MKNKMRSVSLETNLKHLSKCIEEESNTKDTNH